MLDQRRRPEQGKRWPRCAGGGRGFAPEEQDVGSILTLTAVAAAGRAVGARRALRLPVEEPRADGVVPVARRGRVLTLALAQRDEEDVGLDCVQPPHPLARRRRPLEGAVAKRRQRLIP